MAKKYETMIRHLAQLNLQIKHQMEQAEAKVARVNALVRELSKTGLLNKVTILGKHNRSVSYDNDERPDSWLEIIPVLLAPEGLGVCIWDAEQAYQLNQEGRLRQEARRAFIPFHQCEPAEKAFLLNLIEPLLEEMMDIASVAAGELVKGKTIPAKQYFRTRQAKT